MASTGNIVRFKELLLNVNLLFKVFSVFANCSRISRLFPRNKRLEFLSSNPQLKTRLSICYQDLGSGHYRYVCEVSAKALVAGIDQYRFGFFWSGHGKITAAVKDPNQTIVPVPDSWGHHSYRVFFGRSLAKQETISIVVVLKMEDEASVAKPYYSVLLTPEVESAHIEVELTETATTSEYVMERFANNFADIPISRTKKRFPEHRKVALWDLSKEKVGMCYRICWQKEEARPLTQEEGEPGALMPTA